MGRQLGPAEIARVRVALAAGRAAKQLGISAISPEFAELLGLVSELDGLGLDEDDS